MKLRTQLLLGLLVISLVVMGSGWLSLYLLQKSRAYEESLEILYTRSAAATRELDTYFERTKSDLETLAGIQTVSQEDHQDFTSYLNADPEVFTLSPGPREQTIINIFNAYRLTHPAVNSVYMGRANGSFVRSHPRQRNTAYDPRLRPWYIQAASQGGKTVLTEPYPSVTEDLVNIGVVRALVQPSGQVYGVIGMDVTMDNIRNILAVPPGNLFWFGYFSTDGRNTGVPSQYLTDLPRGPELMDILESDRPVTRSLGNNRYILSSQRLTQPPGFLLSAMSESIYLDKQNHFIRSGILPLGISLALMGILMSIAASRLVTTPLAALTRGVRSLGEDGSQEFSPHHHGGSAEFQELSQAFWEYTRQNRKYQEELDTHKRSLEQEVDNRTTELQRALQQAANSEHRLREILRTAQEGFTIINTYGEIMEANPAFCQILDRREEDILGRPLESFMAPDDSRRWEESFQELAGTEGSYDLCFQKSEGSLVPCLVNLAPMSTNDGFQLGSFALITDITEIRNREAQVRQAEEQLRLLFESVQEGIIELDDQGLIMFSNPAASAILGYSQEELKGCNPHTLFHHTLPEGSPYPEDQCPVLRTRTQGTVYKNGDELLWRKDGTAFNAELSSVPLTREGEQIGTVMLFRDISELIEMTRDFIAILENAGDYMFIKDVQGRYRVVNQQFALLLGFAHWRDAVGKTDFEIFPREIAEEFWEEDKEVLRSAQPVTDRIHHYIGLAGDSRYERTSKRPLFDSRGRILGLFGLSSDITDLKHLNDELSRSKEIAEQATKAKSSFLANMSHEIRTPMNAVMGLSHLLSRTSLTAQQQDYTDKITQASQNLLGILNDILDFSKIEAGKLSIESTPFNLQDIIDGLVGIIGLKCQEKNLEFILSQGTDVPMMLIGDPLRLHQILLNLCSNAVKFTHHGEVRVDIQVARFNRQRVVLRFSVADTGIGMSPAQQHNLFAAFSQADSSITRKYGGTGLGLSITKRLVEIQGGTIWLDSQQDIGTTFFFTLELGLQADQAQPQSLAAPQILRDKRALVADDNEAMREVMARYMEHFGLQVDRVSCGQDSLKALESHPPDHYSLFLIDYQMPDQDGLKTIRAIREQTGPQSDAVFILVTAFGDELSPDILETNGVDALLSKPVSQSRLFDTLMAVLGEELRPSKTGGTALDKLSAELHALGKIRILLVEDNEINRQVAREVLEAEGLEVQEALDGQQAIQAVQDAAKALTPPDLILMDLQMPVLDGYSAAEEIRKDQAFGSIPILAMTADAMAGVEEQVYKAGMNGYITKPIVIEHLFQTMLNLLDSRGQGIDSLEIQEDRAEDTSMDIRDNSPAVPNLPAVDKAGAIRRLQGNYKLYQRLLRTFYTTYQGFTERYQSLANSSDPKARIREVHTLKGILGTLGARELQSEVAALNEALQTTPDAKGVEKLEETMLQGITSIIESLEGWISTQDLPAESSSRYASNGSPDQLRQGLEDLLALISSSDSAALPQIHTLLSNPNYRTWEQPLSEIRQALEDFDFPKAQEQLDRLIQEEL